jgi:precorrin-2 dehydrogenase/sirohydrochlorin ferrochelatase
MFPVLLNLKSKRVVIFGGGSVAGRRALKCLEAGAKVRIISRDFTDGLKGMQDPGVELVEEEVDKGSIGEHIHDPFMVIAATDDDDLNDAIEDMARGKGILVNRADKTSDIIIPATLKKGDIRISISTGGKSPEVARALKKRIEKIIKDEDILQLELQEYLRGMLKNRVNDQDKRQSILREVINMPEVIELLKDGRVKEARKAARRIVDAHD